MPARRATTLDPVLRKKPVVRQNFAVVKFFPLDVLLGSISRMKSADVIFSTEWRIGWFACQIFLSEATARCKMSDRPNRTVTVWLCCSPLVPLMETGDLRQFHHTPEFRWLNDPGLRRIFT
jgi:hypothetical protein